MAREGHAATTPEIGEIPVGEPLGHDRQTVLIECPTETQVVEADQRADKPDDPCQPD
ncbi:hypothetical protein D3C71_1794580 [compost metagenome]